MKRKLLSYLAPVGVLSIVYLLGQLAVVKPVLAQVRAALVQSVDEPGRNPFTLQRFALSINYTFTVPAGKRYVVESYTADCETNPGTGIGDVSLLGSAADGTQMKLTVPAHLSFATSTFAFYRGTGSGPLYADANTPLRVEATPSNGNGPAVKSCSFYVTGHVITL